MKRINDKLSFDDINTQACVASRALVRAVTHAGFTLAETERPTRERFREQLSGYGNRALRQANRSKLEEVTR